MYPNMIGSNILNIQTVKMEYLILRDIADQMNNHKDVGNIILLEYSERDVVTPARNNTVQFCPPRFHGCQKSEGAISLDDPTPRRRCGTYRSSSDTGALRVVLRPFRIIFVIRANRYQVLSAPMPLGAPRAYKFPSESSIMPYSAKSRNIEQLVSS